MDAHTILTTAHAYVKHVWAQGAAAHDSHGQEVAPVNGGASSLLPSGGLDAASADCGTVNVAQMDGIEELAPDGRGIASLRVGDFAGLTGFRSHMQIEAVVVA